MKSTILMLALLAFAGCATVPANDGSALPGPNVTGEWKGMLKATAELQRVTWTLKQSGSSIQGHAESIVESTNRQLIYSGGEIRGISVWGKVRGKAVEVNMVAPNVGSSMPPTTATLVLSEDGRTLTGTGQSQYIGPFRLELTKQ